MTQNMSFPRRSSQPISRLGIEETKSNVRWEINIPFQHKNSLPNSLPFCSEMTQNKKGWEAHLSYYASAYNRVETNKPPQDLFISSMWYLV